MTCTDDLSREDDMNDMYDAIIIGARCAGSPTAMLLARSGHRVLLVDRAGFPSDTVSTHVLHASAMSALDRWGLRDTVIATGCPPIDRYSFDFGPFTIAGTPHPSGGSSTAYAPRRTVLDKILVDAAVDAGVEVREHFKVDEILIEEGVVVGICGRGADGTPVTERARVVVGADGRNSQIATVVKAQSYNEKAPLIWSYYSYFRDLPVDGFEIVVRPDRGWAAAPTNDGLTMLVVGWPAAEATAYKADAEANFFATLELAPAFGARVRKATRMERFTGGSVPNYFRKPYGPGWALVGDAGYSKDPITAQGIPDAFRDAERCADALDSVFRGVTAFEDAMSTYQMERDTEAGPIYDFTTQLATLETPPEPFQHLLGAVHGNQQAMDEFVSLTSGTVSPVDFFDPEHIVRIMGAAHV